MSVTLIDVSNNNGAGAVTALNDAAVSGCYAKATEGLNFVDPDYPAFRWAAGKAAKPFGAYHFLHPNQDGAAQALSFLQHAQPKPGDLQPVIDSETRYAGEPWGQVAAVTMNALASVAAHGYSPILYASTSFLQSLYAAQPALKGYRVWQAQYASSMLTIPGVRAVLWQFTDRMVVGKGRFDGDRLLAPNLGALLIPDPHPAWYDAALKLAPMWAWFMWRDHGEPAGLRPPQIPARVPTFWWARYLLHIGR